MTSANTPNHGPSFSSGEAWIRELMQGSAWKDGLSDGQLALQQDLSCLVDGELDEVAAARAMVRLEDSQECREFLDDIQKFARLHKDLSDPQRLEARIAMLGAHEIDRAAGDVDLAHRLSTIFYQLGKAYCLSALDGEQFRHRVFEAAVAVHETKTRGRGFVDGVVASGRADEFDVDGVTEVFGNGFTEDPQDGRRWGSRPDWDEARHLLNGRLEKIEDPLAKGRRLLQQALEIEPEHEEARIYSAFLFYSEGKALRAAKIFREVFDTAINVVNRGHAAVQLGRMHFEEDDMRGALRFWRWMTISGVLAMDARFNVVHFNLGLTWLSLGKEARALDSFRDLVDAYVANGSDPSDVASFFVDNDEARELLESRPGFLANLALRVPELFAAGANSDGLPPTTTT